jgi:hypothetical protein
LSSRPDPRRVAYEHVRKACVIAVGPWGGRKCLFKNRDRNYTPKVEIVHEMRGGVEVLYLHDVTTGWAEGLNEYGIGVVNSALQVGRDEAEKKVVKTKGKKSKDGPRILNILRCTSLEQAIEEAKTYKGGIKGHTVIADPERTYSLEMTSRHEARLRKLPEGKVFVRTNHGLYYDDSGYTEGPDYESSVVRRDRTKRTLRGLPHPDDLAPTMMSKRMKDRSHPNNMVRDTDNMFTTTQMMVNLTDRALTLYLIPDKVEFIGYTNRLPKSREPMLDLRVYEYVDLDGDGIPDTKKVKMASATIPQIVSNCGPEVIDRSKGIRYRRKRLAPSGLSTWEVDGSKGSKYTVRIKPIRKNKSVKRVDKMPVQVSCDCNFFRWQGPEHWAKTNDYLYGKPVGTASKPDVKDPKGKHWACKHVLAVLDIARKWRYSSSEGFSLSYEGPIVPMSPTTILAQRWLEERE